MTVHLDANEVWRGFLHVGLCVGRVVCGSDVWVLQVRQTRPVCPGGFLTFPYGTAILRTGPSTTLPKWVLDSTVVAFN